MLPILFARRRGGERGWSEWFAVSVEALNWGYSSLTTILPLPRLSLESMSISPQEFSKRSGLGPILGLGLWMESWSSNRVFCCSWDSLSPFCLLFPEKKGSNCALKTRRRDIKMHLHPSPSMGGTSKMQTQLWGCAPQAASDAQTPSARLCYLTTSWHMDKATGEARNHFGTFPGHGSP